MTHYCISESYRLRTMNDVQTISFCVSTKRYLIYLYSRQTAFMHLLVNSMKFFSKRLQVNNNSILIWDIKNFFPRYRRRLRDYDSEDIEHRSLISSLTLNFAEPGFKLTDVNLIFHLSICRNLDLKI